ncbi:MAG: PadR family transcriptional regulator [Bryobacteraceae bacterium]|nr:PadR family transcriptional regulator [Bryobacteraceae bacterium]
MAIHLKPNWFHVLLALSEGDQHGYAIMQSVLEHTGGKVRLWPATLYGTLKKLVDAGLIEETGDRPAFDDARRRYYRLTPEGQAALAAESSRLRELVRILDSRVPL